MDFFAAKPFFAHQPARKKKLLPNQGNLEKSSRNPGITDDFPGKDPTGHSKTAVDHGGPLQVALMRSLPVLVGNQFIGDG